ncbi:MAG: anti-sigma factor antagonist [Clostridia bacterium]|nr:anti-sigma factor antagonist [Clostridia bacterium]
MNSTAPRTDGPVLMIPLTGSIDSTNAPETERLIRSAIAGHPDETVVLDCDKLDYITSAGLRVILRLKQDYDSTCLVNVHSQVYEVLEMTGFTELMHVQKAYRVISVEGCEVIGHGANGKVYRIDQDTIVKVYRHADALPEIHRERELARTAFIAGIPTAIPYDVVRIEGGAYGSVFELLNATSFAKLLINKEKSIDEVARMNIDLLKLIHSKIVKSSLIPSMKAVALKWADFDRDYLPADQGDKLHALIDAVPEDAHIVHGDYHVKNIMLQNGEALLIDMDTLSHGHPVFELGSMYNAYEGFGCVDHGVVERFLGIDWDTAGAFWRKSLALYLGTDDEAVLNSVENKAKIISFTRVLRRAIRRGGMDSPEERPVIDYSKAMLADLLARTDTLLF